MTAITMLGDHESHLDAQVDGDRVLVAAADFAAATGWVLKPEGLCRGDVCVPVHDPASVRVGDSLDLQGVAHMLAAPFAAEADLGVVVLGEPSALRAAALDDNDAPDFTLRRLGGDHDGEPFTFSSIGAKKKLLVTWASW